MIKIVQTYQECLKNMISCGKLCAKCVAYFTIDNISLYNSQLPHAKDRGLVVKSGGFESKDHGFESHQGCCCCFFFFLLHIIFSNGKQTNKENKNM